MSKQESVELEVSAITGKETARLLDRGSNAVRERKSVNDLKKLNWITEGKSTANNNQR